MRMLKLIILFFTAFTTTVPCSDCFKFFFGCFNRAPEKSELFYKLKNDFDFLIDTLELIGIEEGNKKYKHLKRISKEEDCDKEVQDLLIQFEEKLDQNPETIYPNLYNHAVMFYKERLPKNSDECWQANQTLSGFIQKFITKKQAEKQILDNRRKKAKEAQAQTPRPLYNSKHHFSKSTGNEQKLHETKEILQRYKKFLK